LEDWSQVEAQLKKLSSIRGRHRSFVRSVTRFATAIQYDGQGRIQISDILLDYSGIQKETIIIGMINKIEIWDPSTLSNQDAREADIDNTDFDDLANEINF
jgi:MraZ protein